MLDWHSLLAAPGSVITLCACAMCTSKPSFCWILTVLPLGIWSYLVLFRMCQKILTLDC